MMQTLRNGALLGILAAGAVATWLLGREEAPPVTSSEVSAPRTFYMRDAAILGTDSNGDVAYRVFAALVEQPEQDESLVLSDVRVEYDSRTQIPWLVTAVRATISKGETMRLYEARLSSLPEPGAVSWIIEADELELQTETHLARSEHPVVLSQGNARLEAERLRADLKQGQIDLEGGHGRLHR